MRADLSPLLQSSLATAAPAAITVDNVAADAQRFRRELDRKGLGQRTRCASRFEHGSRLHRVVDPAGTITERRTAAAAVLKVAVAGRRYPWFRERHRATPHGEGTVMFESVIGVCGY